MKTLLCAALAAALAPTGLAGGAIEAPLGFNVETLADPAATISLADGSVLLVTGTFGDQGLARLHADGSSSPFATGFGSLAGVAQSPVSGQIVVGDSFGPTALFLLDDLNGDGDVLDAGETVPHPVQPPVLSNGAAPAPFDIVFAPGGDGFYMSGSTPFGVEPSLGVVTFTESGSVDVYADGLGFPGDMAFDGEVLLVADVDAVSFTGRVLSLRDLNDDGDALDADEALEFASGFAGAGGFVGADDGSFYLATGFGGSVDRLLADDDADGVSDGVQAGFASGFVFAGSLGLDEGPGGLQPGAAGDGELRVADFALGTVAVRSAPAASTSIDGLVANDASFDIVVGGAPGSEAVFILSFDAVGVSLPGVGDLCLGFAAPFAISPLLPVGAAGESRSKLVLHGLPGLVGQGLAVQGFVLEDGRWGIGDGLFEVVQ